MLFLLLCILIGSFIISSLSATDSNATEEVIADEEVIEETDILKTNDENNTFENYGKDVILKVNDDESNVEAGSKTFSDIQSLINSANSGDTIYLSGTYYGNGYPIVIQKSINLVGLGDGAVLKANVNSELNQCAVYIAQSDVVLDNLKITNGELHWGGGIYIECADYDQGYYHTLYKRITISNCVFDDNCANGAYGYGGGMLFWTDDSLVVNCTFINNYCTNFGGAIYANGKNNRISNCVFKYNYIISGHSTDIDGGGAIYSDCQNLIIENCTFSGNQANGVLGGALKLAAKTNVNNCTFTGNYAKRNGGAIFSDSNGYIFNCSFAGNSAGNDGNDFLGGVVVDCIFETYPASGYHYTSYLNVTDHIVYEGGDEYLTAILYDMRGPVANGVLEFSINGLTYNATTNNEGLARLKINNIITETGEFNVFVSFDGDAINYPASSNVVISRKSHPTLNVNNISMFINDNGILVANLSDVNGPVSGKLISFSVDSREYNLTTGLDGLARLSVKNLLNSPGDYEVQVIFNGDEMTLPASAVSHVIISKYDSILQVNDLNIRVNENQPLVARLYDSRGQLSNKNVSFTINGKKYYVMTNLDGLAKLNITGIVGFGEYDVVVSFDGDDYINPVSVNAQVIISRYKSFLNVDDLSIVLGDDAILVAELTDFQGSLSNRNVSFTVNGNSYIVLTDSNGLATLNVKECFDECGAFTVGVSFEGDELNRPVSTNASVVINNMIYNLIIAQEGKYYGSFNLTFKLVDMKTNDTIPYTQITLAFSNNITVNRTTDSNGEFTYAVPFSPGVYSLFATTPQQNIEIKNVGLNTFEILRLYGKISIVQDEDCRILNIKLFNPTTEEVFGNRNVTLNFEPNGLQFNVSTNDDGVAAFHMDFDAGTYSVIASVSGDYIGFESVRLDDIIINNKTNSKITVPDNLEFNYLDTMIFALIVEGGSVSQDNISIVDHPEAIIDFNTNAKILTISNLTAGNYTLVIKSTPDMEHNSVTSTTHILVKKINSTIRASNFTFDYGGVGFTVAEVSGGNVTLDDVYVVGHDEAIIAVGGNRIYVSNLTAGNYTLNVSTTPDANHESASTLVGIVVNKVDSIINMEDIIFDYGSSGFSNLTVEGGLVSLEDMHVIGQNAVILIMGNEIRISNLTVGNYNLTVSTTPDENHNSITRNIVITVNEADSNVDFYRFTPYDYGGTGYIFIAVDGCEVYEKDVAVVNHPEAIIEFEGDMITVSNLTAGEYTLRVVTTPDRNHKSVTFESKITVNKVDSTVKFKDITFDYLQSDSTYVSVEGGSVAYENIRVEGHPEAIIDFEDDVITVSNLTAGEYTLRVITTPDRNHKSVLGEGKIIVNRIDSQINFTNDIVFDVGSSGFTNATVKGGTFFQYDIEVLNHTEAVINVSGNSIFVSNLTVGEYTLWVMTSPDENHNSVIGTVNIIVNRVPSIINFTNDIVFDFDGIGNTTVNVIGGFVSPSDISVIGQSKAVIMIDNNNMISVSNLTAGNYVLHVVSTPDFEHRPSESTVNITVNKVDSEIEFSNVISFDYNSYGSTDVTVYGGTLKNANVIGYPDADVICASNFIRVSKLDAGNYTLNVVSQPDSNHYSVSRNLSVIVNKADSSLEYSNDLVFDYKGSASTFILVSGGSVLRSNIKVVGQKADISLNNNVITVSGLNAGTYTLSVMTTPDENHKSVNVNISVTVNKIDSKLSLPSSLTFTYLKSASTYVSVEGARVSLASFEVLGHKEAEIKFSNNYVTVSNLNPGKYTMRVTSNPDTNHNADVRDVTVTVNKATAKLTAKKVPVALKKGKWTVKVVDSNKKPISNIKVTLKVYTGKKYKTEEVKTNSKGEATYSTKKLSKGKHKVVASIDHVGYKSKSIRSMIKVVKQTKLKFKASSNKNKDSTTVMFRVYKGGKPANGIKLKLLIYTGKKVVKTIKLKSKTFKKKKGIVGYTTNELSPGKHKVVLKPVDIKYTGSKKATLKLTKKQTKYPPISSKV